MSIRERIRTLFIRDEGTPALVGNSLDVFFGGTDMITRSEAMQIPAVSASVDFIAGTIASLPIKLYRENSEKSSTDEVSDDKRVIMLNDESGDILTSYEIKQAMLRDMLLDGVGYIYTDEKTLRYVSSRDVSLHINADPIFRTAYLNVGGKLYDHWQFIILTRSTKNGVRGEGVISEHSTLLSSVYAMLKLERMLANTGGNKKGFLQSQKKMTDTALDELRRRWDGFYSNTSSNMMILNDGITFVPGANTAVEMQLNQNKTTNAAQIALLFGLSPEVISGRANNEVYASSIRTGIMPIIKKFEAAINRTMLLESEKRNMYFAFDTTELLKGDMKARYEAYRIGLDANFLQPDEVRYKEDLPPLGLDFIKLGLNDVLYDPKTKRIYTPNTDKTTQMSGNVLTDSESGGIIEDRYNKKHDEKGRFAPKDGISLPDIEIGKSLSAKAKNYDVLDPKTGEHFHFSEGTKIQNAQVFAGKGTSTALDDAVANGLSHQYGGVPKNWQHAKGIGVIDYYREGRKAEVHWFQEESVGKVKFKVKRWIE